MQTFWEAQQNLQLHPHQRTAPRQTAEDEVASGFAQMSPRSSNPALTARNCCALENGMGEELGAFEEFTLQRARCKLKFELHASRSVPNNRH